MPITPLHFGVLAPINHFAPNKVSNVSFVLVNLWIDIHAIIFTLTGTGAIDHGQSHALLSMAIAAVLIAMVGVRSMKWVLGAFIGAASHALLDMLVHADMQPFYPEVGNPLYMGWMEPLSLVLLPLTIWFIAQSVSYTRDSFQTKMVALRQRIGKPFFSKS